MVSDLRHLAQQHGGHTVHALTVADLTVVHLTISCSVRRQCRERRHRVRREEPRQSLDKGHVAATARVS